MLKIVFFGSGAFAVEVLKSIDRGLFDISLVVTKPDRAKGRHLISAPTPVKSYAQQEGLPLFQPEDINSADSAAFLKKIPYDIFLVVSYGRILSKPVLEIPRIASINIHSSLLPKYRGAAPVNRALINGEKKTGITFMKMNPLMDEGDIIFQKAVDIEEHELVADLEKRLSRIAADSVNSVLDLAGKNQLEAKKQDKNKATYAPLMRKQDGIIDWGMSAAEVYNSFRGCHGWPGSYTYYKSRLLKITGMKIGIKESSPGFTAATVLKASDNELEVACGKGSIVITEVLPESHRKMPVSSFLAGHRIKPGEKLGKP